MYSIKIINMGRKKSTVFLEKLPEDARKLIVKKKISLVPTAAPKAKKANYSKQKYLLYSGGHDILQNLIVVRPYITRRYNIQFRLLEVLLYLFPMQYFTQDDYRIVPKPLTYRSVKDMLREEMITIIVNGENKGKHLYTLTRRSKEIVIHFYQCLSGEKRIPDTAINPFKKKTATAHDKKRMDLINILNQQEIPDSKKRLFS